jgi:segregation and condensation protein B
MGRATLETLAIIAYRQPITRAEIEAIRGVDVDGVINTLLERSLIRAVARKDVPGRPFLYGTTAEFLQLFNLKDLTHLPTLKEMEEIALPEMPGAELPLESAEEC